jgi:hypothetical protein
VEPAVLYLLDANVLIDANRDYYPIARVPEFWDWLIHVAGRSQVKVPLEIYEELMVKDDALTHWLKNHQQQVLLDEDVRRELVAHVTANGYAEDLDDEEIVKIGRDPFLIAYALADSSSRRVVTTETSRPKRLRANRHLPDVCDNFHVLHCDTFEFLRTLNFTTRWDA